MISLRGKSLAAVSKDIAEGYIIVNPLFLKPLDAETLKDLHRQIMKIQVEIRTEKFPYNNVAAIRARNMRLQRLQSAVSIIKNFAKDRGFKQFLL